LRGAGKLLLGFAPLHNIIGQQYILHRSQRSIFEKKFGYNDVILSKWQFSCLVYQLRQ